MRWLTALLIVWNILDIVIHVAVDLVEPLRIAANAVGLAAALVVLLGVARTSLALVLGVASAVVVVLNVIQSVLHGWFVPTLLFVGVSVLLLLLMTQVARSRAFDSDADGDGAGRKRPVHMRRWVAVPATVVALGLVAVVGEMRELGPLGQLHNGELVAADYWRDEPAILSAGMGFDNIIGVPEVTEDIVREAGGSWFASATCTNGEEPQTLARTTTAASETVANLYKGFSEYDDGLPVVFSWPVASETVDVTDFRFTLNTGEVVTPNSAGMWPNWELNERNTVVVFGDFGNRGLSSEDDAVYPVRLDIVEDDTPLLLVGPDGEVSAVGMSWETDSTPYDSGPVLVGAKLNAVDDGGRGEGGLVIGTTLGVLPNDELAVYDEADFRIRVLTTGGFSPDGVTGLHPDMYEDFFRVHVEGEDGDTVLLEETGVDYDVAGGTLRVVGLSDLGQREDPDDGIHDDDCYSEDRDNYIDIILVGDEAAARNVTFVEIPSIEGGYNAFYNPGGPGPEPSEDVRYTAPGPPDLEPVIIALDDPMRVDRAAR